MAAREATESRHAVKAASLLGVLVLAKLLVLVGRPVPWSLWSPLAYFWQDVLVAGGFGLIDALLGRPKFTWVVYAVLVAYVAINVPVTLVLASPLTWTMMRAARGPLADSVVHLLTWVNVGSILLVAAAGLMLPRLVGRLNLRVRMPAIAAAIVIILAGPFAVARVDTRGLDRNALGALFGSGLPRMPAAPVDADWRRSPYAGSGLELTYVNSRPDSVERFRGVARGNNVIVVALESTAARYLRAYGAADDPTPRLTALASSALVMEDAYSVYPESIKGLFSTSCSRYPAFATSPETHAEVPCESLARVLAGNGYRTALFHSGRFAYLGMEEIVRSQGFELLEDAGAIGGNVRSSFGVDESSAVRRMLAWIDALPPGQRFFISYLPIAGHHPYASPDPGPFAEDNEFGRYQNALHDGDAALGALIDGLRARHLDERTLLVLHGDHGEAFGQHDGNYGHTLSIYDENVRVPLMFVAPGARLSSSIRVDRVASLIDVAPTVLDLLGLPPRPAHQGTSLLAPGGRMALFFTDYSLGWLGLRDGCWKYLYEVDSNRSKLFDVCRDPAETSDRAPLERDRVEKYRERVQQWAAAEQAAIQQRR